MTTPVVNEPRRRPMRKREGSSLVERIEADPQLAVELAAAEAQIHLHTLLTCAVEARTDLNQREIARRLRVTEGRVSQILNGEEDLRIGTFARYFRALGYRLQARLEPAEKGAPEIRESSRARRAYHDVYISLASGANGPEPAYTIVRAGLEIDDSSRVKLGSASVELEVRDVNRQWTQRLIGEAKAVTSGR